MAWKPKTIAGKILKGALIGGGTILGLATGVGALGGVAKGVGALKGASKGIGGLVKVADKIKTGAVNLVTGTTKDERAMIKEVKAEAKDSQHKLDLVDKLVSAGSTLSEARAKLGLSDAVLTSFKGDTIPSTSFMDIVKSPAGMIGSAVLLFVLAKALKIIR